MPCVGVLAGPLLKGLPGRRRLEGIHGPKVHRLLMGSYRILLTGESDVVTVLRVITDQEPAQVIRLAR